MWLALPETHRRKQILPTGEAKLIAGEKKHCWISLSGVLWFNSECATAVLRQSFSVADGVCEQSHRTCSTSSTAGCATTSSTAPLHTGSIKWAAWRLPANTADSCCPLLQNLCVLSGLARPGDGWRSLIGRLPSKCRPADRLIFNVNAHDMSQRIDVSR